MVDCHVENLFFFCWRIETTACNTDTSTINFHSTSSIEVRESATAKPKVGTIEEEKPRDGVRGAVATNSSSLRDIKHEKQGS